MRKEGKKKKGYKINEYVHDVKQKQKGFKKINCLTEIINVQEEREKNKNIEL